MNCQDIADILDDGTPGQLDDAQRSGVEAHVAGCASCAAEWHAQVALAEVVAPMPAELTSAVRHRVAAAGGSVRRMPGRLVLVGAAFAVAAAAAVLVVRDWSPESGSGMQAVEESEELSTPASESEVVVAAQDHVSPDADQDGATEVVSTTTGREEAKSGTSPYRVTIGPLDLSGLDATSARILDLYHAAIERAVARVPGLVLVGERDVQSGSGEYLSVLIKFTGSRPDGARAVNVEASVTTTDGTMKMMSHLTSAVMPDSDIETLAARQVELLRDTMIPVDDARREELYAQLHDPAVPASARYQVLRMLLTPSYGFEDHRKRKAVYRAALEQITSEPDQSMRDVTWNLIRDQISPELYAVAVEVIDDQMDPETRLRLVAMLGSSQRFLSDQRLRESMQSSAPDTLSALDAISPEIDSALERVADRDPRLLTRMVAKRALSGDGEWNQYVIATLKDASLPDVERLEPFAFLSRSGPFTADTRNLPIDGESIGTLGELVARTGSNPQQSELAIRVINGVSGLHGSAGRDVLLKALDQQGGDSLTPEVWNAALIAVVSRHGSDPVVRNAVEGLASGGSSVTRRQRATQVLRAADQLAAEEKPMLLLSSSALLAPEGAGQ